MRWFNAPRSLFYQLLLFFGLPLVALGGISIYTHYFSAMSAATLAYDRTLLASARTVAERLVVRDGKLAVDVPYVVLDSFERNMNDQLYYEVISPQGKSISGYDDLPPLPPHIPRSTLYPALVHFYDAEYLGRAIRVAALFQPINESGVSGMATILVAETLESRRYLARQMMIAALLSQGTVVVLTLILAFALLKRVLKPMRKLSGIMLRRDPGELTPLPRVLPWSGDAAAAGGVQSLYRTAAADGGAPRAFQRRCFAPTAHAAGGVEDSGRGGAGQRPAAAVARKPAGDEHDAG